MTGAEVIWRPDQPPRSAQFGDLYYSAEDGLAEARQVFLNGCGLPGAWRGRQRFTVAELGFGTGLNVLALVDLWLRAGPADGRLQLFSVEAFPLAQADAALALAAWPELAQLATALLARWPGGRRGFHRLDFPQWRVTVDLAVMEAAEALREWSGAADAWFLDGFSPALNPQMWRAEVLGLVAARSAPGARLATYTAAGEVRRTLAAAGFVVERVAGFGAKRHRLEGRWPGAAVARAGSPRVAIVGAGIAGASLARAFDAQGHEVQMFDLGGPSASRAPAALVTPRLDAGLGPPAALFAGAFARAGDLYRLQPDAVVAEGVLQLAAGPKDQKRFAAIADSDLFEPGEVALADAAETTRRLGESSPPGLAVASGLVVRPDVLLAAWLGIPRRTEVSRIVHDAGSWRLVGVRGETLAEADIVCVACGMASGGLVGGLPLRPVRGQASFLPRAEVPVVTLFGGYVAPAPGGVLIGATHDRDDEGMETRGDDHRRNLAVLGEMLPGLAARLAGQPAEAFVGIRATTADYLPLAGAVPNASPGLFVLTGLGSRGFTLAPLLAEHVAALALGAPSPLPRSQAELVDPGRFAARARRRGRQPLAR